MDHTIKNCICLGLCMGTNVLTQEKHVILKSTQVVGTQANAQEKAVKEADKKAEAEARALFEY